MGGVPWDERDHPRGSDGKFVTAPGGQVDPERVHRVREQASTQPVWLEEWDERERVEVQRIVREAVAAGTVPNVRHEMTLRHRPTLTRTVPGWRVDGTEVAFVLPDSPEPVPVTQTSKGTNLRVAAGVDGQGKPWTRWSLVDGRTVTCEHHQLFTVVVVDRDRELRELNG